MTGKEIEKYESICLGGHSKTVIDIIKLNTNYGTFIASTSQDSTIRIWEIFMLEELNKICFLLKTMNFQNFMKRKSIVSVLNLFSCTNKWRCINTLKGHKDLVREVIQMKWKRDKSTLVSISWDHTLKVWNYLTGECLNTLKGHSEDGITKCLQLGYLCL